MKIDRDDIRDFSLMGCCILIVLSQIPIIIVGVMQMFGYLQ